MENLQEVLENHKKWLIMDRGKIADFSGDNLFAINLSFVDLKLASLSQANLEEASLAEANLSQANLSGANLSGANLAATNLSRVNLSGANLSGAYLSRANLEEANLEEANLYRANLSGANTCKVDNFYSVDNVGTFKGKITYHVLTNKVWAGCWSGDLDEFKSKCEKVISKYPEQKEDLEMCIAFFERKKEGK